MATTRRIDTHAHITPDFWKEALDSHGGDPAGWPTPTWTPEVHLEFMERNQIETSILSLTSPAVNGWVGQEKRDMARRLNEYTANLVAKTPRRWGNFATLPLPDIEGTLEEIGYSCDKLSVDGFCIISNYEGEYLGAAKFRPVWEELNRRKAVIFIHPAMVPFTPTPGLPAPILDYPFDTTRTAINMITSKVMDDFKDIKVILAHAGGMLPYVAYRIAVAGSGEPEQMLEGMKAFYYDLALSSSPTVLPSLFSLVSPSHVTFGTDFNYAPPAKSGLFIDYLDTQAQLTEEQRYCITRGTAESLFPRLIFKTGTTSTI